MELFERIERVIYEEGIKLSEFYDRSGLSSKVYYAIKDGKKTRLKPSQAKQLNEAFPKYDYNWWMGESNVVGEPSAKYGTLMDLAEEGKLGTVLNRNHSNFLELDETYAMWFDKVVHVEAMKLLKDMIEER